MTPTDLERDLRATLLDAGDRAPVVDDLATRAVRPVRRRRAWLASTLAAAAVGVAGMVVTVAAPDGSQTATPAPTASMPSIGPSGLLIGTWMPVDIVGYDNTLLKRRHPDPPTISFRTDGRWTGSDGCNGMGGSYRAADDGSITTGPPGAMTLIGCANVPHPVGGAARFTVVGRTLTFSAADGHRLGTYTRVR